MYSNSGKDNKDLECATDPMHPKQDWVMHQYKLRGFGNMSHASGGYNARSGQSVKSPYLKLD